LLEDELEKELEAAAAAVVGEEEEPLAVIKELTALFLSDASLSVVTYGSAKCHPSSSRDAHVVAEQGRGGSGATDSAYPSKGAVDVLIRTATRSRQRDDALQLKDSDVRKSMRRLCLAEMVG
jgi:hypothetical protein